MVELNPQAAKPKPYVIFSGLEFLDYEWCVWICAHTDMKILSGPFNGRTANPFVCLSCIPVLYQSSSTVVAGSFFTISPYWTPYLSYVLLVQ